jgi:hypothetical protein
MPNLTHCKDCIFWDKDKHSARFGKCRRRAPLVQIFPNEHSYERGPCWPVTSVDDSCGDGLTEQEYRAKRAKRWP